MHRLFKQIATVSRLTETWLTSFSKRAASYGEASMFSEHSNLLQEFFFQCFRDSELDSSEIQFLLIPTEPCESCLLVVLTGNPHRASTNGWSLDTAGKYNSLHQETSIIVTTKLIPLSQCIWDPQTTFDPSVHIWYNYFDNPIIIHVKTFQCDCNPSNGENVIEMFDLIALLKIH